VLIYIHIYIYVCTLSSLDRSRSECVSLKDKVQALEESQNEHMRMYDSLQKTVVTLRYVCMCIRVYACVCMCMYVCMCVC